MKGSQKVITSFLRTVFAEPCDQYIAWDPHRTHLKLEPEGKLYTCPLLGTRLAQAVNLGVGKENFVDNKVGKFRYICVDLDDHARVWFIFIVFFLLCLCVNNL